jgi:molybdate transport system substrate-binding protein
MKAIPIVFKKAAMVLICVWLFAGTAYGVEIKVMTSGGFTEAYNKLTPEFERATQNKVVTAYGASMGGTGLHSEPASAGVTRGRRVLKYKT